MNTRQWKVTFEGDEWELLITVSGTGADNAVMIANNALAMELGIDAVAASSNIYATAVSNDGAVA